MSRVVVERCAAECDAYAAFRRWAESQAEAGGWTDLEWEPAIDSNGAPYARLLARRPVFR